MVSSPSWLELLRRALLGSCLSVVLSAVLSLLVVEGSYAGARADATTARAIDVYQPFLEAVGRQFVWLVVAQALFLTPVVLGLLLLLRLHQRSACCLNSRGLLPILLGLLGLFAFFVSVAQRHPGLFLPILASSRLLTACTSWGSAWGTLVFGGAALGYLLRAFAQPVRRRAGWLLVAPLSTGALWFGAVARPAEGRERALTAQPERSSERPSILLLAVDSLRPDMIDAENTPHLSALLADSIYFPNTLVTQPRTGPSWAATLTSLSPLSNGIETMFPDAGVTQVETFALPAHLASLGYSTAVFSEYAGEFFTRANFGFQTTAVPSVELKDISGQMLMMRMPSLLAAASLLYTAGPAGRKVLGSRLTHLVRGLANFASPGVLQQDLLSLASEQQAAGGRAARAPYFWLVFYSQPHFPYTSSGAFYPRYQVEGAASGLRFGRDAASTGPLTSSEDHRQLIGLYRAALAETDAAIGELLARLEAERLLERTIIVLLADHGEGLYECPTCFGHGDNLKSMLTLRVPLAFRLPAANYPGARPARSDAYVSQLDVYPTLLSLLGQRRAPHHEGVPLLNAAGQSLPLPVRDHYAESGEWLWPTPAVPADRVLYPPITELAKMEGGHIVIDPKYLPEIRAAKHRAVIRPPYKLSYEPGATRVEYHLYQYERDPFENEDLAATRPELVAELKRSLFTSMLRHPQLLPVADYFLTRPAPPPPERY